MTLPNVEALVVAALRADAGVDAVVGDRVHGEPPPDAHYPLLAVHRSGGPAEAAWLEDALIQVDSWGTTRTDSWAAAAATVEALQNLRGEYPHGVLTGVDRLVGPQWAPDPVTKRPRYIVTFAVYAHPLADRLSAS